MQDGQQVTKGRSRLPRVERERQLLAAAERLIGEHGVSAVSMDAVAAEVGVSKAMIYAYFGSRQRLLAQVVREAGAELLRSVIVAVDGASTTEEQLRSGLEASFEFVEGHVAWRVLRDESGVDGVAGAEVEAIRRQQAEYNAAIIGVYAHPSEALDPATAEALGEVLVGAVERVAIWRDRHPEVSAGQAAALVTGLLWPGLQSLGQQQQQQQQGNGDQ